MSYRRLRPTQVILDPENPRLPDGTSSDREAINRLLEDGAEDLIGLARDMAQTGQTNPAELPIAIREGSKYLILEGNRRFAALKLMRDPELADNESHQRAFRRAAALGEPPTTVYTLVAASRAEADHWIVLRHTGENSGRGVKRWSPGQIATQRRRAGRAVDSGTVRSITIADEVEETYASDVEIVDLVQRARREKLTNIGRFFSPDVLSLVHLSIEPDRSNNLRDKVLFAHHSADQLRDFFAWAFAYIVNNSVDAYKNADIRKQLLLSVSHILPGLSDAAKHSRRLADRGLGFALGKVSEFKVQEGSHQEEPAHPVSDQPDESTQSNNELAEHLAGESAGARDSVSKRRESKSEKYLFQGLKLPNHPVRVQDLLRECRDVDMDRWPGVACVMARVLVELSVSCDAVLALSGAREADSLKVKLISMLKYLDPEIGHHRKRDSSLAQAYLEASELGMDYLNNFVHNPSLRPDPQLARRFSNAFRAFLQRVDRVI